METFSCAAGTGITSDLLDGYPGIGNIESQPLVGHRLTRRCWRYLQRADCIVVTARPRLLGVAAYQRVKGHVRVVHEFFVRQTLLDLREALQGLAQDLDAVAIPTAREAR